MDLASKLFRGDRVIWIIFMFLCLISLVEVFSATSTIAYKNANHWAPIVRHGTHLFMGFLGVLFLHNIPCKYFTVIYKILMPIAILALLLTPIIGIDANDAHRWLEIGGFSFQPSEFAKLACVVFVASKLSKRTEENEKKIFKSVLIGVGLTCALILPENFSTAVMLFSVCFLMMFVGQLPIKSLAKLAGILVIAGIAFLSIIKFTPSAIMQYLPDRFSTWQARLERFADDQDEALGEGVYKLTDENFQVTHAKIAIARGGVLGQMPGHGQQRDFLPQAYSDFIYAIIIEELGFAGGAFVLLLYFMLLVRVGMIARKCDKLFPKFLVLGCGLLVVVQALANMAVAVNLVPVTGQPLPLVSRGGTSTIISCAYFGLILSISRFGAGIRNEEEGEEEETSEETSQEIVTETVETAEINNPMSAVQSQELKE